MLHNVISKEEMILADRQLARQMTVLRYKMARALCFGHVVDAACDAGYGTWFLSQNPDVTRATGVDIDRQALEAAADEYEAKDGRTPLSFVYGDLNGDDPFAFVDPGLEVDVLVTAETLEHLRDPLAFLRKADARGFRRIVATFPSFKTTHFNPHHLHDLTRADIEAPMASAHWQIIAHQSLFGLCDLLALDRK